MANIQERAQLFIKSYWEYYLELESQFIETKRYVAFDAENAKTFSVEFLKLYQAVCSEIDVVGKEIAASLNLSFRVDENTNIKKWGFEIQQIFPTLKDITIIFNGDRAVQPFKNWEYEKYLNKKGMQCLRAVCPEKKPILWWTNYNKVKHQRIGLVTGTKNFPLANQNNLILSLSALYLLEYCYIKHMESSGASFLDYGASELFSAEIT